MSNWTTPEVPVSIYKFKIYDSLAELSWSAFGVTEITPESLTEAHVEDAPSTCSEYEENETNPETEHGRE